MGVAIAYSPTREYTSSRRFLRKMLASRILTLVCRENSGEASFAVEGVGGGLAGKLAGVPTGMLLHWGTAELVRKLPSGYTEAHSSFSVLIIG